MSGPHDVVIVGGGIAGGALAAVLARGGAAVAVLERDPMPIDRVRGEFMTTLGRRRAAASWPVRHPRRGRRDVRLVSEAILAGGRDQAAFRPYVEERLERLRRLRITASLVATLRAEYGEEARRRRQRAGRRMRVDMMLSPSPAVLVGPEKLPAAAFEQATIDALLAP